MESNNNLFKTKLIDEIKWEKIIKKEIRKTINILNLKKILDLNRINFLYLKKVYKIILNYKYYLIYFKQV